MNALFHVQVVSQSPAALASHLIILGLLALATPLFNAINIVAFLSWLLMSSGVVLLVYVSCLEGNGHISKVIALDSGLYFGAGIWLRATSLSGIAEIILLLILFFFSTGLIDTITYYLWPKRHGSFWIFLGGLTTMIVAIMVWRGWPSNYSWALGVLVGASMLITGVTRLLLAQAFYKHTREITIVPGRHATQA